MPVNTPIYLKTTTPKKGKKLKLRDVLSGDMISPPLGDVRHSAHVGPEGEGDMFGDVGFLQGKMDMLPSLSRPQNGAAQQEAPGCNGFQHQTNGLLRNTVSMPMFSAHEQAPPKPPRLHLGDHTPQQSHRRTNGQQLRSLCEDSEDALESPCASFRPAGVPRSDSMAGLDLDLGPSILEDVLSIMDRYKAVDDRCEL
uniref:Zgc:154093 n=1 Tax=Kryptolebias marmoratus TaxID=37003 RepID=A0A3Q3H0A3_KRYMA